MFLNSGLCMNSHERYVGDEWYCLLVSCVRELSIVVPLIRTSFLNHIRFLTTACKSTADAMKGASLWVFCAKEVLIFPMYSLKSVVTGPVLSHWDTCFFCTVSCNQQNEWCIAFEYSTKSQ